MNTYRKDCFYFSEVIDFGGHIPFCCSTAKLEDCPCQNCKHYISKSDAYQVVRKHQNGGIVPDPLTNRQWLESLTDKELAEFLTFGLPVKRDGFPGVIEISVIQIARRYTSSQKGIEEWLRREQEFEVIRKESGDAEEVH